jgi:hypothetical protein
MGNKNKRKSKNNNGDKSGLIKSGGCASFPWGKALRRRQAGMKELDSPLFLYHCTLFITPEFVILKKVDVLLVYSVFGL